ncbi:MAG TPA: hypothetical protein VF434_05280 [Promineifilum sp.]
MIRSNTKVVVAGLLAALAVVTVFVMAFAAQESFDVRAQFDRLANRAFQSDAPTFDDALLAPTNCRYGVGYVTDFSDSLAWVPTLDAGWYINFSAQPWTGDVKSASFAPVIRISQDRGPNGERLPTYKIEPPLAFKYTDANGNVKNGLGNMLANNPGNYWIIGNEVDVNNDTQDNTMPQVYARAYHEAYHFIKQADPTAKVANAGLSMITPARLQYMTIVWDTYKALYGVDMPVDIWNMHLYILSERLYNTANTDSDGKIALGTDPAIAIMSSGAVLSNCPAPGAADIPANDPRSDVYCRTEHDSVRIFTSQITAMRQWMKARGQQNKPLIISEYSLLYPYIGGLPNGGCEFLQDEHQKCFSPERVTKFLNDTIAFMEETKDPNLGYPADENRLVQQWLWYSIVTEAEWTGGPSNLIVREYTNYTPGDDAALTMMGEAFQQQATTRPSSTNLVAGVARNYTGHLDKGSNTGSAPLEVSFRNSGTRSVINPVQVTFYSDQALTKSIGSATLTPSQKGAITGCTWAGRNSEHVTLVWKNLPVGTHKYWARIDSANAINETSENDNVTVAGTVTILKNGLFVPLVNR